MDIFGKEIFMRDYAYYNGVITPYDSATVPLYDRSIFFAEAVYDVVIGRNGVPYQLDLHLSRLLTNAKSIGLTKLPEQEELKLIAGMLLSEAYADEFMLYIQLSGKGERRAHSRSEEGCNILMTVTGATVPTSLGFTSAITLPDYRHAYCNIKTVNLLPAVFSVCSAEKSGFETAIFRKGDRITEASSSNVSLINRKELITHPLDNSILPGISQRNLVREAENLGLKHTEREFSYEEMFDADAVLLTSTTKLVKLCRNIDGVELKCKEIDTVNTVFGAMLNDLMAKTSQK